ncbi:MAG: hydroxyacid dehydrogenase [Saprospiraceae bacterium]|nr:hydroxyacid dehydrogenase [Lewinella sp.]
MKKNILLLETVSEEADQLLHEGAQIFMADSPSSGPAIAEMHPIHAIITRGKGDVSPELISGCPDLEVIARCGVGLDNVHVDFATTSGVKVVNAPGSNADTVAEHTLALMLSLQRQMYRSIAAVKDNNWGFRTVYAGDEIRGKTLGILGLGDIGSKVARLATAFGMQVIYSGQKEKPGVDYDFCSLEELLQRADIISLHLPLTNATRHLLDTAAIAKMQPHGLIINTSRGAVIDETALLKALMQGTIGGFAADVLTVEPPSAGHPFLELDNVLITPHSASLTARTYNEMCVLTVRNTLALLEGKSIDDKYIFNSAALNGK